MGTPATRSTLRRLRDALALLALARAFAISPCRSATGPATATRRLRARRDTVLQPVRPGRSAHLSLHVPFPALCQPRLSCRALRRPEKEAAAPPWVMLARLRSGSS